MLAQYVHLPGILIIAYLLSHLSSASSIGSNSVDHTADSSFYLCAGTPFSSRAVEINRQVACKKLHNVDPSFNFPAQLEDNRQFDGAHDALFVWPIIDENTIYKTRTPGKIRIVIDLDCNLAGLIIRNNNTPQRCIKLSGNDEVDSNNPDLDVYTGYNCSNAFFSSTYVDNSIAKAIELYQVKLPSQRRKKYPKLRYCESVKQRMLLWPLVVDHTLYNIGESNSVTRKYFVEFSEKKLFKRVFQQSGDKQVCSEISTVILPEKYHAHTYHDNNGRRKRALCPGQIFSGSYIHLNKEKAIRAYSEIYTNKHNEYRYPRHSFQVQGSLPSSSWVWPLRRKENIFNRNKPVVSYILVFTGRDKFQGVFYWKGARLQECQLEDEVEEGQRDENSSGIDLNKSLGCGYCWKSEGCLCS